MTRDVTLTIHVDGGSRGNPGPAAGGIVVRRDDGQLLLEAAYFFGEQTNNAAEYMALLKALERVEPLGRPAIDIVSDSELLVRQITGEYRVKSPTLAALYEQVQVRLLRVGRWSIRHVKREQNARADALANMALDRSGDVVVVDEIDGDGKARVSARQVDPPRAAPRSDPNPGTDESADDANADNCPQSAIAHGPRCVRIAVTRAGGDCPAGGPGFESLVIGATVPAAVCTHALHAIVTTALAIQNTDAHEFLAIPPLTVSCSRNGCRATFSLRPEHPTNGSHPH